MNFYPFHIGDYRGATAHLSNEEDIAYRRLIDMYYDTEQAIPLETQWVSRRLRVATEALKSVLSDFFVLADDGWHNARCDAFIADYHRGVAKNRENGKKGGRPPSKNNPVGSQSVSDGLPVGTHCQGNQEPITNNQEPLKTKEAKAPASPDLFDGIDPQVVSDFKALRAKKKSPITQTAIKGIQREADKAGITLQDALTMCCERGWLAFKAEWLTERRSIERPAKPEKFDPTAYVNRNRISQ